MSDTSGWPLTAFPARGYEELIQAMLTRGYEAVELHELEPERTQMFLRHDVDLSIELAAEIAQREAALGVRSTFYFLLSTRFYNLASADSRRILAALLSHGHALGLHFDTTQYAGTADEIEAQAFEECALLERLAGVPVRSLSFHRPAPELLGRPGSYAGRRHTYEPAFFQSIAYISDSNGGWHHGHPLDHPAVKARQAVQLLTHPIWWCSTTPTSTVDRIEVFRAAADARFAEELRGTVKAYKEGSASPEPGSK